MNKVRITVIYEYELPKEGYYIYGENGETCCIKNPDDMMEVDKREGLINMLDSLNENDNSITNITWEVVSDRI